MWDVPEAGHKCQARSHGCLEQAHDEPDCERRGEGSALCEDEDRRAPHEATDSQYALSGKASDEPTARVLSEEVSRVHHRRQVVELISLQTQRFLVVEEVGIVEGRLVHELESLRDEEDGEDDEVDLPSNSRVLFSCKPS